MKEKLQKVLGAVLGVGTVFFIVFIFFVVVALLSGNLMALFGFRYRSVGQLVLYFLLVELVGLPFDLFCQGLPRALYHLGRLDRRQANLFYIPLDAFCTFAAFWLADLMMESVSATGMSLWVIALVMALLTQPVKKEQTPEA